MVDSSKMIADPLADQLADIYLFLLTKRRQRLAIENKTQYSAQLMAEKKELLGEMTESHEPVSAEA